MTEARKKDVLRETDAEAIRLAKTLIRSARHGALATLDPVRGGPLATRVAVATDGDGAPLILVSALSEHTSALSNDPRCSLLLGEPGKGDPLAHPRISLACRAEKLKRQTPDHERAERRYLNRHPKAKLYAGFTDFSFFRLTLSGASLNGGFGKAYRLAAEDMLSHSPAIAQLDQSEQSAIEHMNADHRDAIDLYASYFAKAHGTGWTLTGIDVEGIDLAHGDEVLRIFFNEPLRSASDLRPVLSEMAKEAREATSP